MGAFRPSLVSAAKAKPVFQPHVGRFTPQAVLKWVPSLALWGGAAAGGVTLFMSSVPLFKTDVLLKIPVVASYFEDKTPESDKPF
ncbi:hypothetical protein IE53DRAFT_316742 [Violaceomyces palustris]|uniref:Uncharacterized protein n=1 Tax=Violaceomyces palustris TaxID=1673888 RepID=A0ACD0NW23_9BASI|nr:hypothetical protein IE53DRAFT_316742 [Violaceomyces palustris]